MNACIFFLLLLVMAGHLTSSVVYVFNSEKNTCDSYIAGIT